MAIVQDRSEGCATALAPTSPDRINPYLFSLAPPVTKQSREPFAMRPPRGDALSGPYIESQWLPLMQLALPAGGGL